MGRSFFVAISLRNDWAKVRKSWCSTTSAASPERLRTRVRGATRLLAYVALRQLFRPYVVAAVFRLRSKVAQEESNGASLVALYWGTTVLFRFHSLTPGS